MQLKSNSSSAAVKHIVILSSINKLCRQFKIQLIKVDEYLKYTQHFRIRTSSHVYKDE